MLRENIENILQQNVRSPQRRLPIQSADFWVMSSMLSGAITQSPLSDIPPDSILVDIYWQLSLGLEIDALKDRIDLVT